MAQYCKYCSYCIDGDCYYCTAKEKVLGDEQIHHTNKCKLYIEAFDGSVIDGKKYQPRKRRENKDNMKNMTIYDY